MRIHVLGALSVSGNDIESPRLSNAVRRLIALVAASGAHGISRDELAIELWGDPAPESWKSALRNRVTAARKAIGADALQNRAGRFFFADYVTIDSWDLIRRVAAGSDGDAAPLGFLDGDVLAGIEPSPLVHHHRAQVADARAVLIQQLVARSSTPLSPLELQALRSYQRLHPLEPLVTQEVVRAHVSAGESAYATKIIGDTVEAASLVDSDMPWIDELDTLRSSYTQRRRRDDHSPVSTASAEDAEAHAAVVRAELFAAASSSDEWGVAFEIAMEGLPEAARTEGDPDRLKLLESIPLKRLPSSRQLALCTTMAHHLMAVGRESDARDWASLAQSLAHTNEEQLLTFVLAAIVGSAEDERAPIPLPPAFDSTSDAPVNMQSMQVVVMSHLERSSTHTAAPLVGRFNELVEASADPYRRWHMKLLQSMSRFVDGEFDEAAELARRAHQYADLFSIADADVALLGQLSNPHWIHDGFAAPINPLDQDPAHESEQLSSALHAIGRRTIDGGQAANSYMQSFDFNSRSFFSLPRLMAIASHVTDPDLRRQAAARLGKRSGTSAIWGSGVMHLGPVDRVLAGLSDTPVERTERLGLALRCADMQQSRLWQVVCGLDLAYDTNDTKLRERTQMLANTPSLKRLITDYQPITKPR